MKTVAIRVLLFSIATCVVGGRAVDRVYAAERTATAPVASAGGNQSRISADPARREKAKVYLNRATALYRTLASVPRDEWLAKENVLGTMAQVQAILGDVTTAKKTAREI